MDYQIEEICPWTKDIGPWSDDITKKEKELLSKRLNEVFRQWMEETNNKPSNFRVINVKRYEL